MEARATKRQWFAVLGGLLGAFMAILDISITNASLQDIQGGLSATLDEGAWISTAYLVAEIIVIPLTGFFVRVFSIRRYLLWNSAFFLFASVLCGLAHTLPQMIAFRALQGFSGGVLIPLAVTLILTRLPRAQQATGFALFGIAATFAPCIGPTIGGWLTVNYSWPLIFFLNLVPGAALIGIIAWSLDEEPHDLSLLRRADWTGIATMAVALGSLTVILEEGVREDWWSSPLIVALSWSFALSLGFFLWHELRANNPVINLRLLKRRNFFLATAVATIFGYGLYGSIYMLPYFLASVRRYDAEQIGQIILWQGLPQLLILPFIPKLMAKLDPRAMLAFGFLLFGVSAVMNSGLTRDWGYDQFFWSQIVRACGQPFVITPLTAIAYVGIEPAEIGSASGLNNMMRNLGGSVGIGSLGALFNHQYHLHFTRLAEATSRYALPVQLRLGGHPGRRAVVAIFASMNKEAFVMSFGDCFFFIALLFFAGTAMVLFTKKPGAPGTSAEGAH
jgi:DHA2 family multidrug resistance protein